jgi:uncharacterized membrane protein
MEETRKRTCAKIILWSTIAFSSTVAVAYAVSGTFSVSLEIAAADGCVKMALLTAYERAWNRVGWGREPSA